MIGRIGIKGSLLIWRLLCSLSVQAEAMPAYKQVNIAHVTSTQQEAIEYLESINKLGYSKFWPNVKPALFLQNIRSTIYNPLSIYPGMGTIFVVMAH